MLSMMLIFIFINRGAIQIFIKTDNYKSFVIIFSIVFCSALIGIYNQFPITQSISLLLKFLLMGSFMFLGFVMVLYGKRQMALVVFAIAIIIHLHAGIVGYFLDVGVIKDDVFRPTGMTGRVSILANIALFSCIFYGVRAILSNRNRVFSIYIALISFTTIIMCGTLKNLAALLGAVGVFAILSAKRKVLTIFIILFVSIPTMYVLVFYTPIGERIIEAFVAGVEIEVEEGEKLESSLQWRVLHWKLLLDDWYARFFWHGSGLGQEVNMNALKLTSGKGFSAHSDWIKFFIELGPILFCYFVYMHIKLVKPIYEQSKSREPFDTALFYTFVSMVIAMLAGPVYDTVSFFYCFWFLLGISSGQHVMMNRDNKIINSDQLAH